VSLVDQHGDRAITVIGERLTPIAADPRPWPSLAHCDGVFVTACDAEALRLARRARVLAATPRLGLPLIHSAGLCLDALVGSANDPGERYAPGDLDPAPGVYVGTEGARGGFSLPGGRFRAQPRPAVEQECGDGDSYGAGDSFAAGFTTALAAGWGLEQALTLGGRCGAACITGRGAYAGQIDASAAGLPLGASPAPAGRPEPQAGRRPKTRERGLVSWRGKGSGGGGGSLRCAAGPEIKGGPYRIRYHTGSSRARAGPDRP
jgi:ribokinase